MSGRFSGGMVNEDLYQRGLAAEADEDPALPLKRPDPSEFAQLRHLDPLRLVLTTPAKRFRRAIYTSHCPSLRH